jgi:hypothetical protein
LVDEQSNRNGNNKIKSFHEEKSQNPSRVEVSLDNADTVIEGGPLKPGFGLSGNFERIKKLFLCKNRKEHGTGRKPGDVRLA